MKEYEPEQNFNTLNNLDFKLYKINRLLPESFKNVTLQISTELSTKQFIVLYYKHVCL